ncbi:serine/threonine-protein kinase [Nocardia lasii]|uniref:non-specific serine/threonine protein kinase n=1 Tax=Nocardia lasii TaxID=1616107 RepID=A0ABW1JYQ0_9NOCA
MGGGAMAGSRFGRYEIRRLLGVGGMGEVYEAYDTSKNRVVALKMLNRELAGDPTFVQRFRRESHAMASVQEPHVIPVHDWGEVDGVLYIDMRLVKGVDLKDRLQQHGSLTPAEAVGVVEQIAFALDAAHEVGLVHRDVKPANILLTGAMFAYLVDFGIAHTATDPQLTGVGSAVGSMAYMAPERFESVPMSPAVDTYALTCVLYECLVGRVPFPVNSLAGAIGSHQMAPPPRPSAVDPALAAFDPVIERGMAKRPEHRFATPGDLARAARAALVQAERSTPSTISGPRVEPPPAASANHPVNPPTTRDSAVVPNPTRRVPASRYEPTQQAPGRPPGYTHPSAPLPVPPQRNSSTPILAGALVSLIVLAVIGGAVWFLLSMDNTERQVAVPPSASGQAQPPPQIVTVSQPVPTTVAPPKVTTPPRTTVPPLQSSVSGADGQGFVSAGPRCNDNDAAMTIARTSQSRVVICHTGDQRYYYKGVRASDGAGIELDDPVPNGGGAFTATNPTDGTRYQLSASGFTISSPGRTPVTEPVTEFAHR